MAEPALNLTTRDSEITLSISSEKEKNLLEKLRGTHTEELVIGLCGFIGTNIDIVSKTISKVLREQYNYEVVEIKLSELIKKFGEPNLDALDNKYDRYRKLIDEGNRLRSVHNESILAELAINEISVNRELSKADDLNFSSKRVCFLINSIKHKDELELFKLIYSDLFYSFGLFSSYDERKKRLIHSGIEEENVISLMNQDIGEKIKNGQHVYDTFVLSDFFLRFDSDSTANLEEKLKRYFNLIFQSDIVTPSSDELAMYAANSASGNSACLSRQVGASITDEKGNILSLGWNDVPKFGGGVYNFDVNDYLSSKDHRCIHKEGGKCFNDEEKDLITISLVKTLMSENLITEENKVKAIKVIKDSKIKQLIEFSRAVHAEMSAIINAGITGGNKIIGGKLYCTTYPCHNCARHIVAAGIKEVYYIEPYRKSLAIKLHDDSITENETETGKLRLLMFEGVSPKRYLDFFKMTSQRKDSKGKKIDVHKDKIFPKKTLSLQSIPKLEKEVTENLISRKII
ncbi:deoxycytidylate deaminase [Sphingobacteriaceae bacterium]|nr:deoxycytidylate deaminase [Sphingobacteriaceae bacterium]